MNHRSVLPTPAPTLWLLLSLCVLMAESATAGIRRLAAWRFETAEWLAEDGTPPRTRSVGTNIADVAGVVGRGVEFRAAGGTLIYPLRGGPDRSVVDPSAMSLGFYYRPSWSSTGETNGHGPGEIARLVSVGDSIRNPGGGWWELSLAADGTRFLLSYGSDAKERVDLSSRACRLRAGVWSEIRLAVHPGRVRLFFDGDLILADSPRSIGNLRTAASRSGICFGSDPQGRWPAMGALDEIEIHDAPLDEVEVRKSGYVMSARVASDGAGLDLRWRGAPSALMELQRTEAETNLWVSLAKAPGLMAHRDRSAQPGRLYRYRVLTERKVGEIGLAGGWRLPPVEDRGVVLLIIDRTQAEALSPELSRWERTARADGWRVRRYLAPRHDDREWRNNTNAIETLRAWVRSEWESSDRRVRGLFLVGHVVIPYGGIAAEDLHTGKGDNHYGAWPSDQYYGDVDGIWTDREPYPTYLPEPTFAATRNVPGDGKFDTRWVPPNADGDTRLEIPFGRVDFAGMLAFGRGASRELGLLRQYFDKVQRYREGRLPAQPRTVMGLYFGGGPDWDIVPAAYRTGSHLFGFEPEELFQGDLFEMGGETAVWGFQSGGGHIDRIRNGLPSMVTTAQIASGARQPRVLFAMLLGSWFGDWAVGENNLLRGILGAKDYGLASFWVRHTEWRFDALARGGTLGDAQLETANEVVQWLNPNRGTTRTLTILGDPTLRLHPVPPPASLRGKRTSRGIELQWRAPAAAVNPSFCVYRAEPGPDRPWVRLTSVPLGETEFVDANPPTDARYRVKAVQLIETASGSYTNLGLAATWPAEED